MPQYLDGFPRDNGATDFGDNFYVYRHISCFDNTVFYVGKGKNKRAWSKKGRNKYWKRIATKYGFYVELILENLTEQEAFKKEKEFIKLYRQYGMCETNLTDGGEGPTGFKHTPETIKKLSEITKKLLADPEFNLKMLTELRKALKTPEYRKKRSEISKKMFNDPVVLDKISKTSKRVWQNPEYRKKMVKIMVELHKTPAFKQKMSNASKVKWKNPEFRKKRAESLNKTMRSPNHRQKVREIVKSLWQDPDYKENMIRKIKKTWADPERRSKQSETTKNVWKNPEYRAKVCKKVINVETGVIYPSAKDAANLISIRVKNLRKKLVGSIKNDTPFMYLDLYQEQIKKGQI